MGQRFPCLYIICTYTYIIFQHQKCYLLEVIVDSAANPVSLQSQVHVSAVAMINVVLVQDIVETLV